MTKFRGSALSVARVAFGLGFGMVVLAGTGAVAEMGLVQTALIAGLVALVVGWVLVERCYLTPLTALAETSNAPIKTLSDRLTALAAEKVQAQVQLDQARADVSAAPVAPGPDWSLVDTMLKALAAGRAPDPQAEVKEGLDTLAAQLDRFKSDLRNVTDMELDPLAANRMSGGPGWFGEVSQWINQVLERTSDAQVSRAQAAARVSDISKSILDGAQDFSGRIEAQAAALEETAATMEEVSAAVATNAESASDATKLSSSTAEIAARGLDAADKAVQGMHKINESARKISEITTLVDGIAFQTNLLSLNAAVEAARAGEAGKGFAVVASEVRTLAQRAAEAARSISELVAESTVHVSDGVTQVEATGSLLVDIQAGIEKVVNSISEISAATRQQASGIGEVSQTLSNLDDETQSNATLVTRTISEARQLGDLAATLGPKPGTVSSTASAVERSSMSAVPARVEGRTAVAPPSKAPEVMHAPVETYVPRPSHKLPSTSAVGKGALVVANEEGWEEF